MTLLNKETFRAISNNHSFINRRSFLQKGFAVGAGAAVGGLLANTASAAGSLTTGDAALLRFPAALEILEADFWIQYNELAGVQDAEVPGGSGIPAYTKALEQLDSDMAVYVHDNTDDEITHHRFLNAYLVANGAAPANLDAFRTLMGSTATGVNRDLIGKRLTNLTQLTLDTSWWTRYRDDSHNPDLDPDFVFPQAFPTLAVGQHTAIPRTDADLKHKNFIQAMANTAGFHFPTIEQGGNSLYPSLAQRATSVEVLRILISIGPTETMHFQTWSDKAGNAPPLTAVDPVTGVSVTFPDLNSPPFGGELFQTNLIMLIMPEPCPFLDRMIEVCRLSQSSGQPRRKAPPWVPKVPHGHGAFHRPIARVFRVYNSVGPKCGCSATRSLSKQACDGYNPATGTWQLTASMHQGRLSAIAELLEDGKVLVAGGADYSNGTFVSSLTSAEIYDPSTGKWTQIANMPSAGGPGSLLSNGDVLVVRDAFLDPGTGTWTATGPFPNSTTTHHPAPRASTRQPRATASNTPMFF